MYIILSSPLQPHSDHTQFHLKNKIKMSKLVNVSLACFRETFVSETDDLKKSIKKRNSSLFLSSQFQGNQDREGDSLLLEL